MHTFVERASAHSTLYLSNMYIPAAISVFMRPIIPEPTMTIMGRTAPPHTHVLDVDGAAFRSTLPRGPARRGSGDGVTGVGKVRPDREGLPPPCPPAISRKEFSMRHTTSTQHATIGVHRGCHIPCQWRWRARIYSAEDAKRGGASCTPPAQKVDGVVYFQHGPRACAETSWLR